MIARGKYQSLTMVNWNGFFARTFDIDNLVTTLSGGNGAGKSTTMAAFITALIPDQSLLHFRNTTEAGSSSASRDKGLFGKLQPGTCYASLDIVNSRNQRLIFAVKLQQVAGRDKKVDIKPFLIQGLPSEVKPTQVFVETLSDTAARVRPLDELKQSLESYPEVQFKTFNSVTDYHSLMFDMGVLPKKLRNTSDRSKFYRLIEASLYGGISSAITRSLRDYLLPQNGGVKKAFQDMESALRENRMTLEAIKTTQADRDLFKHLILESTNYVAADYMRHANERRIKLEQTLALRSELMQSRSQLISQNNLINELTQALSELTEQESSLEQDHQGAADHFQLVQNALRQQEKITRYQDDLDELSEHLEEQIMVVEEASEQVEEASEQAMLFEDEVDSLKSQLADYQQALDVQQTRALQYNQAISALEKAKTLIADDTLSVDNVSAKMSALEASQNAATEQVLSLKHKLDMVSKVSQQFETAFELVKQIAPTASRDNAAAEAKALLEKFQVAKQWQQNESQWRAQHKDLSRQLAEQDKAQALLRTYAQDHQQIIDSQDTLELEQERLQEVSETLAESLEQARDKQGDLKRAQADLNQQINELSKIAPSWIQASEALEQLREQSGAELLDSQSVMSQMQLILEEEKQLTAAQTTLGQKRTELDQEIDRLASPSGVSDPRLKSLADTLGGVLLSEIYDDITIDDAPYFSAMYGPARHGIVVSDLDGIEEKLSSLDDCPDDVYIIEGDVDAFDDSSFNASEIEGAVCVRLNERQIRYSRLPQIPLFGRAAREDRLALLRDEREQVQESYAKASFDAQKQQRLYQSFNQFVSKHIQIAFIADPEAQIKTARDALSQNQAQVSKISEQIEQIRSQISSTQQGLNQLGQLASLIHLVEDDTIGARLDELNEKLAEYETYQVYLQNHQRQLEKLAPIVQALDADPQAFSSIEAAYKEADQSLQQIKTSLFALSDVYERRHHFTYLDSIDLVNKSSELSEQLKAKLAAAEVKKQSTRASLKQAQIKFGEYNQVLASLKSSYQAKQETVQEFRQELVAYGISVSEDALEQAQMRKDALYERLSQNRNQKRDHERTLTATELEVKTLAKRVKKVQKDYQALRTYVVNAKAGWCSVLKLARDHDVERRLHRRELAYLSDNELRSMSDKALGALRIAVADNETLRDALRGSEDAAYPERKVLFYIAVYQHLRERIRQDIIHTNDPVEAIEEMEVELARLTEELSMRENRLAMSSKSVASIIEKTILREQNRIRMLNQGLSNISFGQVRGVRLNVNVRQSHETLLAGLQQEQEHQDLFDNANLTFSEAMAKLFQRVNPHIDMGQRSAQVLGEELLDYRNYLELSIEVNRGSEGWLQAESGALSTGEAIGTGQSILLMVVQSWEEESRRLRSKDIVPCRLLFLDEAARLDTKSINTLFELCERLDMQLLIAAPENISPERGTTYKLVRKIFKDHEHVHVVGLKGFGQAPVNALEDTSSEVEAS